MRYPRRDPGYDRIATLDIETTHYRPEKGEIVSIGIGVHDRGEPGAEATYGSAVRSQRIPIQPGAPSYWIDPP